MNSLAVLLPVNTSLAALKPVLAAGVVTLMIAMPSPGNSVALRHPRVMWLRGNNAVNPVVTTMGGMIETAMAHVAKVAPLLGQRRTRTATLATHPRVDMLLLAPLLVLPPGNSPPLLEANLEANLLMEDMDTPTLLVWEPQVLLRLAWVRLLVWHPTMELLTLHRRLVVMHLPLLPR